MCGIAGFFDPVCSDFEARERLESMLALIAHRGPDGAGTHFAPPIAMGMRRLSIIDLEGGWQPIWNEDETIGVVFNGEIYNYLELVDELTARGHRFRTHTDTEVLVHLYEERGAEMFEKLRGMFGFAILDLRQRQLLLARDHFGQKPLYYTLSGDRFAFASELKCLLALPWVSRERDPSAFLDYVSWLSLPPPRTHFTKIRKLAAGECLTLPLARHSKPTVRKYWSYRLDGKAELSSPEQAVEALESTLRDSLKVHLRSDVPIGVLLSSGLDSRVVAAYAQELQSGQLQTFTVGFGAEDSELVGAAQTAREIQSQHHDLELTHEHLAEDLERVAWHLDEPVGDPAAFAVLRVCELAREEVKVLLSGEGSDELFGGYEARYAGMLQTLDASDRWRRLAPYLPEADLTRSGSRWHRLLARIHHSRASEAIVLRIEGLPGDVRHPRGLNGPELQRLRARAATIANTLYRPQRDYLSELLALDLDWQLAESLLQKADKMSMAASIELRTPILDLRVAELAAQIPSTLKLPQGGPGKWILRKTLAHKLNEEVARPKKGFPVPLRQWFCGPLREQIEEEIFAEESVSCAQLDRQLLRAAWDDFQANRWDGARLFYALWLYEAWARVIVAGQPLVVR